MTIAVLHHLANPFLGNAVALGPVQEVHVDRGDELPELDRVSGIVSLGGEQSAWDDELQREVAYLRAAVDADVPVLGVCLGAQLLARALGATVRRSERFVGWRQLQPLPAGANDPLLDGLPVPIPALHFNQDVFDLPEGAEELVARVDPHSVEAFRRGRAWGVQFHPDTDADALEGWIVEYADYMTDPDNLRAGPLDSRRLFANFAEVAAGAR